MEFKVLFGLLSSAIFSVVSGKHLLRCEIGQFYDILAKSCVACSTCEGNDIVRKPCSQFNDVKCGPFFLDGFDGNFNQNFNFLKSKPKNRTPSSSTLKTPASSAQVEMLDDEGWYKISMILLALLCLMSTAIAIYIVFACFVCRKKEEKEIIYQPEFRSISNNDDDTPRYVETYIPSRDRLKSHPHTASRIYVNDITSVAPLLLPSTENIYVNCTDLATEDYVYLQTTQ